MTHKSIELIKKLFGDKETQKVILDFLSQKNGWHDLKSWNGCSKINFKEDFSFEEKESPNENAPLFTKELLDILCIAKENPLPNLLKSSSENNSKPIVVFDDSPSKLSISTTSPRDYRYYSLPSITTYKDSSSEECFIIVKFPYSYKKGIENVEYSESSSFTRLITKEGHTIDSLIANFSNDRNLDEFWIDGHSCTKEEYEEFLKKRKTHNIKINIPSSQKTQSFNYLEEMIKEINRKNVDKLTSTIVQPIGPINEKFFSSVFCYPGNDIPSSKEQLRNYLKKGSNMVISGGYDPDPGRIYNISNEDYVTYFYKKHTKPDKNTTVYGEFVDLLNGDKYLYIPAFESDKITYSFEGITKTDGTNFIEIKSLSDDSEIHLVNGKTVTKEDYIAAIYNKEKENILGQKESLAKTFENLKSEEDFEKKLNGLFYSGYFKKIEYDNENKKDLKDYLTSIFYKKGALDFAEALLRFKNMAIYYKNDKKTKEVSYLYKIYGDNPIMSFAMLELLIPEELKNDRNTKFRLFTEALIQPIDRTLEKEKKENLINEYMQDLNFKKGPSK